jgi:ABC-type transport system substrate-binding protein
VSTLDRRNAFATPGPDRTPRTPRPQGPLARLALLAGTTFLATMLTACGGGGGEASNGTASDGDAGGSGGSSGERQLKVLRTPITTSGPRSLDPALGTSTYDNRAVVQAYETLLQYKYLARPLELTPLLLESMPEVLDGGTRYRFTLRDDLFFHDDECFPGGEGRKLVTDDVFYSWKRLADPKYNLQAWPRVDGMIVGFNEYKDEQNAAVDAGEPFDYDVPVEGMVKIDDRRFEIVLPEANRQFLFKIATFQMAIVPREAVEFYGEQFNSRQVGTGPFKLVEWIPNSRIVWERNPEYREAYYPSEGEEGDAEKGLLDAAGQRIPLVDRLEIQFFVESNPMWLEFKAGKLDFTTVPQSAYEEAFDVRTGELSRDWRLREIDYQPIALADFIYRGFNLDDELVGGYTPEKIALRRAIALTMDLEEINESQYNGIPVIYDGVIPPGVDGHLTAGSFDPPNRGPDFERARELLQEAGFTVVDGRVTDLPPIDMYTARGADSEAIVELWQRNLNRVGIQMNPRYVDFAALTDALDESKAPMFSLAWGMAYPDAEYNLQLFYGPNEAPGPNAFNFRNAEYDSLFEQIKTLPPGEERTAVYNRMQELVNQYCVFVGSQARVRQYLVQPWIRNFKATEDFYTIFKYMDVDMDHPNRPE